VENVNPIAALAKYSIPYRDDGGDWIKVMSVWAEDSDKTCFDVHGAIHRRDGTFKCIKTDTSMSLISYLQSCTNKTIPKLKQELLNFYGSSPVEDITDAHVEVWTKLLLSDAGYEHLAALKRKGIGPDEIIKYRIGLNKRGLITIPVYSADHVLLNVRQYDILSFGKAKYRNPKGAETFALYLPTNINTERLFITGGELKAILMSERGFPSVSPTFGEKKWPDKLLAIVREVKEVFIVYDVDETGKKNAIKLANQLVRFNQSVKVVYLHDVADIPNGDITNYFIDRDKSNEEFESLLEHTERFFTADAPIIVDDDDEIVGEISLNTSIDARYHQKMLRTKAMVSAKDTQPYVVPKKLTVRCPQTGQECCAICPYQMGRSQKMDFNVSKSDSRLLSLVDCGEEAQESVLKTIARIPSSCKKVAFERTDNFNIEVLRCIPQVSTGHSSHESSPKTIYYVGHGLEANVEYEFTGRAVNEPRSQRSTLLVTDAVRAVSDIDNFGLSFDLRVFQPAEWTKEALSCRLHDMYEDLENNVTGIFNRRDMHLAIDLVYHSVLYFPFQNKTHKGWADILIIGDSGQGKSEANNCLRLHYKAGEKIDTKRASAAGLVGGAQQTNKRWFITWGTIPLNDRRLVVLEEVKGASPEVLTKLTDMRSSGQADLQLIERAKTNARTRLIWNTNPRSSRNIGEYNYGVDAILELMGSKEDIRRFDMAIAVATGEVDIDVLNGMGYDPDVPHFMTSELCNHLIMWAWSRRAEQIEFTDEATKQILEAAKRMGSIYSPSIPLVEPSDQRLKIARLSTALAARTFSTEDGEILTVRRCHVEYIEEFLCRVYDSEALGYREFSKSRFTEAKLTDVGEIVDEIKSLPNNKSLAEHMLYSENVTWNDIADFAELDKDIALKTVGIFVRNGALRKVRRGGYRKTPAFIDLLKDLIRSGELRDGEVKLVGEI